MSKKTPLYWLMLTAPALTGLAPPATSPPPSAGRLTVVERRVAQDQGGWIVTYRVRYHGPAGMIVTPSEVLARLDGWVSNSRISTHAIPRWSSAVVSSASGLSGTADVMVAASESLRCRERATIRVWADTPEADGLAPDVIPASTPLPIRSRGSSTAPSAEPQQPLLSVAPGSTLHVRLRLEHLHDVYGDYDPLLGVRSFQLHLGSATLRDAIPLDREQYVAQPRYEWPVPPEDRRDTRHYVSAPDSIHLEAHIPGNQWYRFPERPVRYGTRMRLSYWYLIAAGTEGECRARVVQAKDTPTVWKALNEGSHEECLGTVGRWIKVERVFRTERDATLLTLDFRITGSEVGEMWVDDVRLEPLDTPPQLSP